MAPATAAGRLVDAGVTPTLAADLASRHPSRRIADVLDAVTVHDVDNPPGWITSALAGDWDLHDLATQARTRHRARQHQAARRAARQDAADAAARHARTQHRRSRGWADLAADLLDDNQLGRLIEHSRDPRFPPSTRSVRLTTAQITGWVAAACHHHPDLEPDRAVATALANPASLATPDVLPPPPRAHTPPLPLDRRIAALLPLVDQEQDEQRDLQASTMKRDNGEAA